jgi:hypothetical protein
VPLETAWATSGDDDPERPKRQLFARRRAGECSHALLVEEVDTLPVRYLVFNRVMPAVAWREVPRPYSAFDDGAAIRRLALVSKSGP